MRRRADTRTGARGGAASRERTVERLRRICLALPEANEKVSHGEPTWFAGKGKVFAMLDDHHHGAAHLSVWLPHAFGAQEALIRSDPERFFRPPYVGVSGWVGVVLDTGPDWNDVARLVREAYLHVATAKLRTVAGTSSPAEPGRSADQGGASHMAERKPAKSGTQQSAKRTTGKASKGFTEEERVAMRERAQELAAARRGSRAGKADGESDVLAKIAEMPGPDRAMAERLHAIIKASAPALSPKTWYGMPAYAMDGEVVCYFQSAQKFKSRYATFGFSDKANLDEGAMWPTSFALKELTTADEARIVALVKKAVS
jgi:uncharacterized protein YdhG (YjbR/CyaY superfamily)